MTRALPRLPTRSWRVLRMGVAWGVAAACTKDGHSLDAEQRRAIVAEARNAVEMADAKRRQTFATAAKTLVPRADLGACPVVVHAIAPGAWSAEPLDDGALAKERVGVAVEIDVATKPGPLAIELRDTESDLEQLSDDTLRHRGARLSELARDGQDFELITRPAGDSGALAARLYVWDYAKGTVVCVAEVTGATRTEVLAHAFEDPSRLAVAGPPIVGRGSEKP
jgi:hypothetical protein